MPRSVAVVAMLLLLAACESPSDAGAGPPTTVEVTSGGAQTELAGLILPQPVVVRVSDAQGHPLSGVTVTAAPSDFGRVDPATPTITNELGEVSLRWRLGATLGPQTLEISLPSVADVAHVNVGATATGADVIAAVSSGDWICAAWRDGRVGCWAVGTAAEAPVVPAVAPGSLRFTGLVAGSVTYGQNPIVLCAPATTGRVWCTTFNRTTESFTPWSEVAGSYQSLHGLSGTSSTPNTKPQYCGLDDEGVVWCWGANDVGKLGDGTTVSRDEARPVLSEVRFQSVSAAASHVCALAIDGAAYCWGNGSRGQLGRAVAEGPQLTPMPVETPLRFVELLTTLEPGTCGISVSRDLYCWGDRFQLGRSSPLPSGSEYSAEPLHVPGTGTTVAIAYLDLDTFVIAPGGTAQWWGSTHATGFTFTPLPTRIPLPFNAVVSNGDGPYLCGRTTPTGGVVCLYSRDAGPGIPGTLPFTRSVGIGVPALTP